ncbi:hypothetical protein SLS62_008510 [Diatrype stigma]|uniref:Uncharacterized protein n=1 Tax=Diatrype stigma TaxID=117547 RepID=A0AAN9UI34_9PEZI
MATPEVLAKTFFTIHSNDQFMTDQHNAKFVSDNQNYTTDVLASTPTNDEGPEGTPAPTFSRYLRITTDHKPKDPRCGFVFGSDHHVCDILLDVCQKNGVSKKQFAIVPRSDNAVLLLKNYSKNGTRINSGSEDPGIIKSQRAILDEMTVTGSFYLQIRVPDHEQHQAAFTAHWRDYSARIASSIPPLTNLDILTGPSLTQALDFPHIPKYKLQLGNGHSGTVYKAVDPFSGSIFAVKVFKDADFDREAHAKIFGEARMLQRISHKHIVKFHAFTMVNGIEDAMLVMEHVQGRNLAQEHKADDIQITELRTITKQLLEALKYMHAKGIAHRDVKPLNVIVSSRNPIYVKLVDFGMASRDTLRTFCGTSFYTAPEIYDMRTNYNDACYTSKVDIWALGVMFLELSYGLPSAVESHVKYYDHPSFAASIMEHLASQDQNIVVAFASSLLTYLPNDRPTAEESLTHTFFSPDALTPHMRGLSTPKSASMILPDQESFTPLMDVSDTRTISPSDLQKTEPAGPSQPSFPVLEPFDFPTTEAWKSVSLESPYPYNPSDWLMDSLEVSPTISDIGEEKDTEDAVIDTAIDTSDHGSSLKTRTDLPTKSRQNQSSLTIAGGLTTGTGALAERRPRAKRMRVK